MPKSIAILIAAIVAGIIGLGAGLLLEKTLANREYVNNEAELAEANRRVDETAARAKVEAAKALEEFKTEAIKLSKDYANEKLNEFIEQQKQQYSDEELAIQLARLSRSERTAVSTAMTRLDAGGVLDRRQIEVMDSIPALRERLGKAALAQEKSGEFSDLFSKKKP